MPFFDALFVAFGQVFDEASHGAVKSLALVGPCRVDVVGGHKGELGLADRQVRINGFQFLAQRLDPNVDQRLL